MHIAICDDNIALRKQLERLLQRESDSRKDKKGLLYIDSYGNPESLLRSPMIYDAFIINSEKSLDHSMDIALLLRTHEVSAPIILCKNESQEIPAAETDPNFYFITTPIRADELTAVIDRISSYVASADIPMEIRGDKETHYILEKDLTYIRQQKHLLQIKLSTGSAIEVFGELADICHSIKNKSSFFITRNHFLLHTEHIKKVTYGKVTFQSNEIITIPILDSILLKKIQRYKKPVSLTDNG